MRVLCVVLCILLTIFEVSAIRSEKECSSFSTRVVTINNGYKPYWFQMHFSRCIQGNSIPEIPVFTLHVSNSLSYNSLLEIANFSTLKEVYLDSTELQEIPEFIDVPALQIVSLASNKLTKIRTKAFGSNAIQQLILSRNQISNIEKGAFGNGVETIYLTCNNITTLSPTWFLNPAQMKFLNLGGNKITVIPDNMFKDFINLNNLDFRNNQILTLGVGSISGPNLMQNLYLSYNNISEIKAEVFGTSINITNFNVEYNRLSFLHQALMDKMTAKMIIIWGNPWQCPCLKLIDAWISKNNKGFSQGLPRDEDPSCVTALSFRNVCVPFVDDDLYETFLMTFEMSPIQFC